MTPRHSLASILGFTLSLAPPAFAQYRHIAATPIGAAEAATAPVDEGLAADILARIEKSGADVGIAFRTLDGKRQWFSRADEVFHAASTMKVPVMIELFHQAREAKVKLDDPLLVKNEFHSLADNSIYILDPADDSETELYKAVGQTQTLGQLCELMRRAPYQHFPAEADYKPDSYPVRDNFGIFKRAEISLIFRVSDTRQSC